MIELYNPRSWLPADSLRKDNVVTARIGQVQMATFIISYIVSKLLCPGEELTSSTIEIKRRLKSESHANSVSKEPDTDVHTKIKIIAMNKTTQIIDVNQPI